MTEQVDHPSHYNALGAACPRCDRPIECFDVVEQMSFLRGNAVKYLWRAGLKGDTATDLRKAIVYIERELALLEGRW